LSSKVQRASDGPSRIVFCRRRPKPRHTALPKAQ
jgi:hypothetical protein